jgi:very-short-patch-repair endonuclease
MAAVRHNERILHEIGAGNHGVASRAQLIAHGMASHVIDRMIRSGRLAIVRRGVYRVGPLEQARSAEMSAVLRCGAGCRISHMSAAALLGVVARGTDPTVDVTLPRSRRCREAGLRVHRVRDVRADEVAVLDGIPVTTAARTLLDVASIMSERDIEQALATALRSRLVTRDDALRMADRHPLHRGSRRLRQLLAADGEPAFTRSEAEEKLLRLVRSAKLPRPELNARVAGHEVDFMWRDPRVIAEADGWAFHGSARSFAADRRRDAELAGAGYRVLRFTWADVTDGQLLTVARLAQALAR